MFWSFCPVSVFKSCSRVLMLVQPFFFPNHSNTVVPDSVSADSLSELHGASHTKKHHQAGGSRLRCQGINCAVVSPGHLRRILVISPKCLKTLAFLVSRLGMNTEYILCFCLPVKSVRLQLLHSMSFG